MKAFPELVIALREMLDRMDTSLRASGYEGALVYMYLAGGIAVNYYCGTRLRGFRAGLGRYRKRISAHSTPCLFSTRSCGLKNRTLLGPGSDRHRDARGGELLHSRTASPACAGSDEELYRRQIASHDVSRSRLSENRYTLLTLLGGSYRPHNNAGQAGTPAATPHPHSGTVTAKEYVRPRGEPPR
jgi:hypothetical protein